jgi:hypothetical protein
MAKRKKKKRKLPECLPQLKTRSGFSPSGPTVGQKRNWKTVLRAKLQRPQNLFPSRVGPQEDPPPLKRPTIFGSGFESNRRRH